MPGLRNHSGQNLHLLKSREAIGDRPVLLKDEGCGGECGAVGWNPTLRATGTALAGIVGQKEPACIGFQVAFHADCQRVFARRAVQRGHGPGLRNHSGQNVNPLKSRESIGDHLALMHDEGCGGQCGAVGWNPTLRATGVALTG